MGMNPFEAVTNYASMLNKIAWSTFCTALLCIWVLHTSDHPLVSALATNLPITMDSVNVPLGMVLPALIIALSSRFTKFHNVVSSVLKIRHRFDTQHILRPMASRVGGELTPAHSRKIGLRRNELMRRCFYAYASSGDKRVIDSHYVTAALDQWAWYWMSLEAVVCIMITAILLALNSTFGIGFWALIATIIILFAAMKWSWNRSIDYASDQITQILLDDDRHDAVRKEFDAVLR